MNRKQQAFVLAYLKTNNKAEAYMTAVNYRTTQKTAERGADKILQSPEVSQYISDVMAKAKKEVLQEIENKRPALLTVEEKREILAKIARGEARAVQYGMGQVCSYCGMSEEPTFDQILQAIQKNCTTCVRRVHKRMFGAGE